MPALRLTPEAERSQDVDLLRQVRATTRSVGSEKCWHFCQKTCFQIIIPSSLEALQDAHGLGLEGEESGNPMQVEDELPV